MRVLLANPPTYEGAGNFNRPIRFPTFNYATPVLHPPLLLMYAAAFLRSQGHEVHLVDCQVDAMTVGDFVQRAASIAPDVLVFETSTPSFNNDVQVAAECKERSGARIVFVGPHVSALPAQSLVGPIDAIVVGEYEAALADYLKVGPEATPGIAYRGDSGQPVVNPHRELERDLDSFPFPARDILPNYKYFDPILKNPFTFVLSGRGCPFECIFCNWPQVMSGRGYRRRSASNIVDELQELQENYEFKSFLFNDDTFTANRNHAMAVCNEMMRRGIRLPWACYSRADNNDVALLEKMREAGCFALKVGIESGDQGILDNVHKKYRLAEVEKGVRTMLSLGFHVHCTFVFGLPGETKDTIQRTIEFAKRLNATTVQFSTAVPYPGTELYSYLSQQGYLLTKEWDSYMPMHPIFQYPELSTKDMANAVKTAYRRYYFRPGYFATGLRQLFTNPLVTASNVKKLVQLAFLNGQR